MQTLTQIRQLLESAGLAPQKRFGQCFLIDHNLMGKVLELADLTGSETVLEVGPGTGSLTEELLRRSGRVIAVEVDRGLCELLGDEFADKPNFTLLCQDVLAGKHAIAPQVLDACRPEAQLVSNLPYNIATPLLAECLLSSWRRVRGDANAVMLPRMTFTVQREVADRLTAAPHSGDYGPVSVLVSLLSRTMLGPVAPGAAFWPRPNVSSRIMRIDFHSSSASELADADMLMALLNMLFGQRRKQIGSIIKASAGRSLPPPAGGRAIDPAAFAEALVKAGVEVTSRAEEVAPEKFLVIANALSGHSG